MTRAHHYTGLLFVGAPCAGHYHTADLGPTQIVPPVESGTSIVLAAHGAEPALLRDQASVTAHQTKSLCCAAAGIINPFRRPEKAHVPHERLRWAAPAETTLIASYRPHAQPAKGYKQSGGAHA